MKDELISIKDFCSKNNFQLEFFDDISDYDFLEIYQINGEKFIDPDDLDIVYKVAKFYYDLDINFEGIEVIMNLLNEMSRLKEKIRNLENTLNFFE
jgi:hypothetical protein